MDGTPIRSLELEWQVLRCPRNAARFRKWAQAEPPLASFAAPPDLVSFLRGPAASARKDEVLLALLRALNGEALAGRILLEALLPGLKVLARKAIARGAEREEVWSLLLGCAWARMHSYPLARRPTRVAANLLTDTFRDTLAQLAAARKARAELLDAAFNERTATIATGRSVDDVLVGAVAGGVLSLADAELILATRFDGVTLAAAASALGVAYNTLKVRRQRAERRLIAHLGFAPVPRGRQRRHF